jgi:hypothetical protein
MAAISKEAKYALRCQDESTCERQVSKIVL